MSAPLLVKPIPAQIINERAAYRPLNLNDFIQSPDKKKLSFSAEVADGQALPKGMICTSDGQFTGIPATGTEGSYQVKITATADAEAFKTEFSLTIKSAFTNDTAGSLDAIKSQIWDALEKNLPLPTLMEAYERPITSQDIYHLLERWGILIIWEAFNLKPAGEKIPLTLDGMSEHYHVYDRGSSLIMAPKDLFSHERTLEDGLKTARAMAREVYRRDWTIELAGFDKLTRVAWIEIQLLSDQHGKSLNILNYNPSTADVERYRTEAMANIRNRLG